MMLIPIQPFFVRYQRQDDITMIYVLRKRVAEIPIAGDGAKPTLYADTSKFKCSSVGFEAAVPQL